MRPKTIPHPRLTSARALGALEMNAITFDRKHTVLTPEVLAAAATSAATTSVPATAEVATSAASPAPQAGVAKGDSI